MLEKIIQTLKRKKLKGEVLHEKSKKILVKFKTDEFHSTEIKEINGVGLKVIKNNRIGFTSVTDPDMIRLLPQTAEELSKFGEEAKFDFPPQQKYSEPKIYTAQIAKRKADTLLEWGKEIISICKEIAEDVKVDVNLSMDVWEREICNTAGLEATMKKTTSLLGINIMKVTDEGLLQLWEEYDLSQGNLPDFKKIKEWMKENLDYSKKKIEIRDGKYDLIILPEALFSILYPPLAAGINGINYVKNTSPLIPAENKEIFDPRLSIYDDATLDYKFYSAPWDGEGIPHQKTCVVEDGVFKNFLFDLQTAGKAKRKSTGNSVRTYSSSSSPGTTTLVIKKGEKKLGDMIKEIKDGILAMHVVGGGQSNTLAGEFSVTISHGYRIEKGEIIGRVKDVAIAGNIYSLLKRIKEIGEETKEYPGFISPWISIEDLRVAAKR